MGGGGAGNRMGRTLVGGLIGKIVAFRFDGDGGVGVVGFDVSDDVAIVVIGVVSIFMFDIDVVN